jgi:hypothetical protein
MNFPLKLFHGISHVVADGLDVEPLCRSNVRVTQDRLDHGVRDAEPLEIRPPDLDDRRAIPSTGVRFP